MSLWSRIWNVFRNERLDREIDEEVQAHLEEAMARGREREEARRSLGGTLRYREESRDLRLIGWLDSLRADAVFGWRQLHKRKMTSAAAVLSLGLAIGSCTSAFRLIDALLLRPLPVAHPDRLYALFRQGMGFDGKTRTSDSYEYPVFGRMRTAVEDRADLIAVSYAQGMDLTYRSEQEMERGQVQYVSGTMFGVLGLNPAVGRLFTKNDDRAFGAHPCAVLSYDYWARRFGRDRQVIGRTFRLGSQLFEIVGVAEKRFTGTEPGTVTDIFVPVMMNEGVKHADWAWFRILVQLRDSQAAEPVQEQLRAIFRASQQERAKGFIGRSKQFVDRFLSDALLLEPAGTGVSEMQTDYRVSLTALGALVTLVLLIACANLVNLMMGQGAARAREMALRVSIGAGRRRLVQLVLVESCWLAFLAAAIGGLFAWWSAPLVASRIQAADHPARLLLPVDWRVLGFGMALTAAVTLLFGLAPALRASAVKPATALRGGEDPHSRRRLMHGLIVVQAAFCFVVLFVGGLFVASFDRLAHQPIGFSSERLLLLDTVAARAQPAVFWDQLAEDLRRTSGVEAAALAGWPLLSGSGMWGAVSIQGEPPSDTLPYFLNISPGWTEAMKIRLLDGRDFQVADASPGTAMVNEVFAKEFLQGENPIGKSFERIEAEGRRSRYEIVGLVSDTSYRSLREPIMPTVYIPFHAVDGKGAPAGIRKGTIVVRTTTRQPLALAPMLRREVPRARPEFRVSNIRTQTELVEAQTIRERLLAGLALFFAGVAVLLAGVGLYGVLDYSVLQRRREIGIRIAVGAQAGEIARRVAGEVFARIAAGTVAGGALGLACARYIHALLYQVKPAGLGALGYPALVLGLAALLAALPAVIRAIRIDPVTMLRSE